MTPNSRSHHADPPTNTPEERTTSVFPLITITDATPQRTSVAQAPSGVSTSTPAVAPDAQTPSGSSSGSGKGTDPLYRLLYRGALSLPDSYLQLDGIAFSARLPNRRTSSLQDSPSLSLSRPESFARELMYNPLALALESMRGRQSLRFKGTVRLQDVWVDDTGDVYMDIHPFATLTKIYFENILCLSPLAPSPHDACGPKRTETGVHVSLGDTDGPETTDIIIYGEVSASLLPPPPYLPSAATSTHVGPPPLSVRVARIMTAPRAPRPDDPTPRQPRAHLFSGTTLSELGANKRIPPQPITDNGKERGNVEDHVLRRAREVMLHLPRSKGLANRSRKKKDRGGNEGRSEQPSDAIFRVPELPAKARRKRGDAGTDVFGAVEPPQPRVVDGKGKGKAAATDRENEVDNAIEGANKLVLKRLTVRHLSDAGISRSHSEFKDVFGFVYRGAAFALRSQMKALYISAQAAKVAVEAHVKLYASSATGAHDLPGSQEMTLQDTMGVNDAGD